MHVPRPTIHISSTHPRPHLPPMFPPVAALGLRSASIHPELSSPSVPGTQAKAKAKARRKHHMLQEPLPCICPFSCEPASRRTATPRSRETGSLLESFVGETCRSAWTHIGWWVLFVTRKTPAPPSHGGNWYFSSRGQGQLLQYGCYSKTHVFWGCQSKLSRVSRVPARSSNMPLHHSRWLQLEVM